MKLRRMRSVLRKEWRHIVRDRSTAVLVMLSPVVFLIVLAYSFSIDIKLVSMAVMDLDRTPVSRDFTAMLSGSGDLVVCCATDRYDELERWLVDGRAKAAVVVPPGFMSDVEAGDPATVQVIVDGTDPNTAAHAMTHIVARTEVYGAERYASAMGMQGRLDSVARPPIDLRVRTWYNPSLKYINGMIPALIAVALTVPAIAASLAITREKEWGTFEALVATPLGRADLLVGKLIPYVMSGMVSAVLCAAVAVAWFGVPMQGSYVSFFALTLSFLFATLAIGVLISVLLNSQQAAMIVSLLVFMFPGFFLSGILIPLSAMGIMKLEAYMMPTTHYVLINRGLFNKGAGIDVLWPYGLALLLAGGAALIVSILIFKKRVA